MTTTKSIETTADQDSPRKTFVPTEPSRIEDTGIHIAEIEALLLKAVFHRGYGTGSQLANQVRLPYRLVNEVLTTLKNQMYLSHRSAAQLGDYEYELGENGMGRVRTLLESTTYSGAAPVPLQEYLQGLRLQSLRRNKVTLADIREAMFDLMIGDKELRQIGQAVRAGRCLFLFGAPGNGKTSIATRVIHSISDSIWIPRTLLAGGELIRVYDPTVHEAIEEPENNTVFNSLDVDERWVRIKRPNIVVGGELTLESLEVTKNVSTGVLEAPVHIKANGGCLVVDDFGRQRISTSELLNRWIIPLECSKDFATLPNGRHIEFPFEQLLVFSTNLKPATVCDEAFLRIPYKVEIKDPTDEQFTRLFQQRASKLGIDLGQDVISNMIEKEFRAKNRELRFCHADDFISQVEEFCAFEQSEFELTERTLTAAALNFFAGI